MILLLKGKAKPTWSISPNGKYFKNPAGKWVPRKGQGKPKQKLEVKLNINSKAEYYDPKADWKSNGIKSKVFKDWFGDWEKGIGSKVTTKTGEPEKQFNKGNIEPIKMYHGTGSGSYSEFDLGHSNTGVLLYGGGFYFTADKHVAETYQKNNAVKVYNFNTEFHTDELKDLYNTAQATAYGSAKKYLPDPIESDANKTMFLQTLAYMYNRDDLDDYTGFGKELRGKFDSIRKDLGVTEIDNSKLFEVYLNIRKPFDIDTDTIPGKELGLEDKPYKYMQAVEIMHFRKYRKPTAPVGEKLAEFKDKIQAVLKSKGYDGITHIGGRIVGKGEGEHRVWIAFNAEAIKSINNEGTFDTSQRNIYKSLQKAKRMAIGTVSHGRKKVAEGKWTPVKKGNAGLYLDKFELGKLDEFIQDFQKQHLRIQQRLNESNLSETMRNMYTHRLTTIDKVKAIITAIKNGEVRFHDPNSDKGDSAVIHKSSRGDWKWQISYFDERGPFHHDNGSDLSEILHNMLRMGNFVPGKPKKGLLKSNSYEALLKAKYISKKRGHNGKWQYLYKEPMSKTIGIKNVLDQWLLGYGKGRPETPPIPGIVFRVMANREWQNMKLGYFSGSFWSSDPTEVGAGLVQGNTDDVIVVTKQIGVKKYRGMVKDKTKQHYHELEKKELKDVLAVYKYTGTPYNGKFVEVQKAVKLIISFTKGHKRANVGEITTWADGTKHRKLRNGKWENVIEHNSRKQDKSKIAKKRLEIATGKRNMEGAIKREYEASIDDNAVGYTIAGLLEYVYGAKDYEGLSALVARSNSDKLSEIFRTIKDAVDQLDEDPRKEGHVTRGMKRFHIDMFGRSLLKLKQIHAPTKLRLTVPVKLKTGNVKGVYIKKIVGIPAKAMKEARSMTGSWKNGRKTPTTVQVNELIKLGSAKLVLGKMDANAKWTVRPLMKDTIIPFKVEETGITVKIQQYKKNKGKKRGYAGAIVDLHVPYAYALSFLKNNMKSVRTRNALIGQMERSKGYRRTILKEKDIK